MRFDPDFIVDCAGGALAVAPSEENRLLSGITWDSRSVTEGDLYVALPGQRVDGHEFVASALRSGAHAALVSRQPDAEQIDAARACGGAIIVVEDTFATIPLMARAWRAHLTGCVLALTGSSGKTTTKNLVADVLSAYGSTIATTGNQNNELGVPATILRADADTRFVVVEMGMRGLHQLEDLCAFVQPDMALVTNVGTSHMELLGSRENIARAKAEPFASLREGGVAFINASDEYAFQLREFGNTRRRGIEEVIFDGSGADPLDYPPEARPVIYASDIALDAQGHPTFELHAPESSAACVLQMRGLHNVHNAVAAAAIGWRLGMPLQDIVASLGRSKPVSGRQQVLHTSSGVTIVDDSYNANPDSMGAALDMFASLDVPGRKFAVLGDMGELGSFSEEGHALMGKRASQLRMDRLICVGLLSRSMALAALEAGLAADRVSSVDDASDALVILNDELREGDAVLVKASHSMALERIVEGLADTND